jgi:hypothetical protein
MFNDVDQSYVYYFTEAIYLLDIISFKTWDNFSHLEPESDDDCRCSGCSYDDYEDYDDEEEDEDDQ